MAKQERASRTRQALIRAAAEVFTRQGFTLASLTTISRRAGVSNGALHFHFENKKALAWAVEDAAAQSLHRITGGGAHPGEGALDTLVDGTRRLTAALAEDVVLRAGFELNGDPSLRNEARLRGEWQRWVEETLRQAARQGALAEGISSDGAARAVVAATVGLEVLGAQDSSWLSSERIQGFWDLMLPSLTSPCPREPSCSAAP
jgi:AcrR family transcriptional regulator